MPNILEIANENQIIKRQDVLQMEEQIKILTHIAYENNWSYTEYFLEKAAESIKNIDN